MTPNAGYVIAGYLVTALALGGYTLRLFSRARTAKRRAQTIADRRRDGRPSKSAATPSCDRWGSRALRSVAERSGRIRPRRSRLGPP